MIIVYYSCMFINKYIILIIKWRIKIEMLTQYNILHVNIIYYSSHPIGYSISNIGMNTE